MSSTTFFRTPGARIALDRRNGSGRVAVFFAGRGECGREAQGDFGGAFAEAHGLNAILVQPAKPTWYQPPGLGPLMAALARALKGFHHVTFAGFGMGAYGAMAAAQHAAADHVVAVRPVATLDARHAPVSKGQARDRARLGGDIAPLLTHRAARYSVLCANGGDARHAARLYLPPDRTVHLDPALLAPEAALRLAPGTLLTLLAGAKAEALSA